jgi:hypothetical protein
MGMKQTLDVLNRMEVEGVIDRYAIGGAVGAYNYIEPAVTEDDAWTVFCRRTGITDPCKLHFNP